VVRHFINAHAEIGGAHEILAVAQYRNRWRLNVIQSLHQPREAPGVFSRAVCNNGDRSVKVGEEQKLGGNLTLTEGSRRINDDRPGLLRHTKRPTAFAMHCKLVIRDAIDPAAVRRTSLQPARRVAIGIRIDQRGRGSAKRKVACQVGCQGGLTATALGIQNDNLVQVISI